MAIRIPISPFARWLVAIPITIVAIFTIVPILFAFPDAPQGHALSHSLPAIVIGLVAVSIARTGAARRPGERLALGALAVLSGAQLMEAVSAFTEYPNAGLLHGTTSVVTLLALVAVLGGVLWALAEATRSRRFPAWTALLIAGGLGAMLLKMMIGF